MELIKDLTIDLYNPYPLPIMNAKQGDTGRGFSVTLKAGSDPFTPEGTVNIYFLKPDGTKVYTACTVEDNVVSGVFTNQTLAVPGELQAEIQFTSGTEILSTPIFVVKVLPSNIDDSAIESADEFTALEAALGTLSSYNNIQRLPLNASMKAVSSLDDAFASIGKNNVFAVHVGTQATSDSPTNASGYWGCLSFRNGASLGAQLVFTRVGLFYRTRIQNAWSTWTKIDPTYTALTSGQSSVTVNGAAYSQIGQAVTVNVWFTPTEAISGVLTNVFSSVPRPLSKVVVPIYPNSTGSGVSSAGYAYIVRGTNDIRFSGTNLTSGTGYCFTMSYLTY